LVSHFLTFVPQKNVEQFVQADQRTLYILCHGHTSIRAKNECDDSSAVFVKEHIFSSAEHAEHYVLNSRQKRFCCNAQSVLRRYMSPRFAVHVHVLEKCKNILT